MSKINNPLLKGFTLVELLVAASLAAILGLAVVSTFATGLKAYGQLKNADLAQANILLSSQKIEKDLKNTFHFSGIDFTGDKTHVSFAGFIHGGSAIGRLTYYFDAGSGGALFKTEQPYSDALINNTSAGLTLKAVTAVKGLSFSYFCFNPDTQQYSWKDSFSTAAGIPTQVRIKAVFQEGKEDIEYEKTVFVPVSG